MVEDPPGGAAPLHDPKASALVRSSGRGTKAMRALAGRYRLLILTAAALGGVALVALLSTGGAVRVCPVGQRLVRGEGDAHERAAGDYESHFKGRCAPVAHLESDRDLARFSE